MSQDDPDEAAVECHAAMPDHQDFERMGEVVARLPQQHLPEPAADLPESSARATLEPTAEEVERGTALAASVEDDELRVLGRERPVAWVSGEGAGVVSHFENVTPPVDAMGTTASLLGLVVFDGTEERSTLLGFVHPHGRWLEWRA